MNVRRILVHGTGLAAIVTLLAALRPGLSDVKPARKIHRALRLGEAPPPTAAQETETVTQVESSSPTAVVDLQRLAAGEPCARLESARDSQEALTAIFVLGNTASIGPTEVEVLRTAFSRWENDEVRCRCLWALGLAQDAYPLAEILDIVQGPYSVDVRCFAVASMAPHLDDGTKKAEEAKKKEEAAKKGGMPIDPPAPKDGVKDLPYADRYGIVDFSDLVGLFYSHEGRVILNPVVNRNNSNPNPEGTNRVRITVEELVELVMRFLARYPADPVDEYGRAADSRGEQLKGQVQKSLDYLSNPNPYAPPTPGGAPTTPPNPLK